MSHYKKSKSCLLTKPVRTCTNNTFAKYMCDIFVLLSLFVYADKIHCPINFAIVTLVFLKRITCIPPYICQILLIASVENFFFDETIVNNK